jgi:hypothetical protein
VILTAGYHIDRSRVGLCFCCTTKVFTLLRSRTSPVCALVAVANTSSKSNRQLFHFKWLYSSSITAVMTVHKGSCHCKAVTFEFDAPDEGVVAWDCDCKCPTVIAHITAQLLQNQAALASGGQTAPCCVGCRQHLQHEAQHACFYTRAGVQVAVRRRQLGMLSGTQAAAMTAAHVL